MPLYVVSLWLLIFKEISIFWGYSAFEWNKSDFFCLKYDPTKKWNVLKIVERQKRAFVAEMYEYVVFPAQAVQLKGRAELYSGAQIMD